MIPESLYFASGIIGLLIVIFSVAGARWSNGNPLVTFAVGFVILIIGLVVLEPLLIAFGGIP